MQSYMENPSTQTHFDVSKQIDEIIMEEQYLYNLKKNIENSPEINESVLSGLGDYIEEPYTLVEAYFKGQHLERLVRHQIESYNNFINYQIQKTIQMFNPVSVKSENDYVEIIKEML